MALRIAVLVKQVPKFENMQLGPDGRLQRAGVELELNPYCRRAVSKGVELVRHHGGHCTVFTLGPPAAEDALREAIAWGADDGVLITDPAFAGSDTLATARALTAALTRFGPFDMILTGRNSVDADTGQVGPEIAELLGLPFLASVRRLDLDESTLELGARCEYDDGWVEARTQLPVLVSCAERLCDPAKVDPEGRAAVAPERIRHVAAPELGDGAWGQAGSPTEVGEVRVHEVARQRIVLSGSIEAQVAQAVALLRERGALAPDRAQGVVTQDSSDSSERVPVTGGPGAIVAVLIEGARARIAQELLGAAARLAHGIGGRVVAIGPAGFDLTTTASQGADEAVLFEGVDLVEEDVAQALGDWCETHEPWALLAPGTMWGREVASRVAARLGAGLTGDAIDLEVVDGHLVGWKPAFGGRLVAAITATSALSAVTVRPGMLAVPAPRDVGVSVPVTRVPVIPKGRVRHLQAARDDELDTLARAAVVVGVGTGVDPAEYGALDELLKALGAELAATRKVTDKGWQPRARQVGITGRSIRPRLYVAVGLSGKFNHVIGVRSAGSVLAINRDPEALVFDASDIGIVGDWHEVVPALAQAIGA